MLSEFISTYSYEIIFAATAFITGALIYRSAAAYFSGIVLRRKFRRGEKGEQKAGKYLKAHGFKILGYQSALRPHMLVDGKKVSFSIKADYLVKRHGRTGVVEVKTGKKAPNPASSSTRRQILEYSMYYRVDDVYLFDAETETLHEINFPRSASLPQRRSSSKAGCLVYSALLIAITAGILALVFR
ncbi:MAG: hypothetical protein HQK83_15340 [Fibrobacteria bacterium]|nr:hypothetical protein [Fibrobacteria bacterium]